MIEREREREREREPDNSTPPSDKAAGENVMEGIHRKIYSEAVIEGMRKKARVFVGDSIVRKTDRILNKGRHMRRSTYRKVNISWLLILQSLH